MIQKYITPFVTLMIFSFADFFITAQLIGLQDSYDVEANPLLRGMMIQHDSVLPILFTKIAALTVYGLVMWVVHERRTALIGPFMWATSTLAVIQAAVCGLGLSMLIQN